MNSNQLKRGLVVAYFENEVRTGIIKKAQTIRSLVRFPDEEQWITNRRLRIVKDRACIRATRADIGGR